MHKRSLSGPVIFLKELFEKVNLEKKSQQMIKKNEKIPSMQRVNYCKSGNFREILFSQMVLKDIFATFKIRD